MNVQETVQRLLNLWQEYRTLAAANATFINRLKAQRQLIARYQDWELQEKARACVPLDRLHEEARQLCQQEVQEPPLSFEDALVKRLLLWFKNEFFKWVNEAPCSVCGVRLRVIHVHNHLMTHE